MISSRLGRGPRRGGFTLVEALVAFAILVLAVVGMIWSRSKAVQDVAEARNLKLAVKIARETLGKLRAGMNQENLVDLNTWQEVENCPDFYVRVVTGDLEISDFETYLAEERDDEKQLRRLDFQERLRLDRESRAFREGGTAGAGGAAGMEAGQESQEELPVDEDTVQAVLVAVKYPSFDFKKNPGGEGVFVLRDQISTLALSGLTPEQAEDDKATLPGSTGGGGTGGEGGG